MQPPLPLLERLKTTIKRSKGNMDEVGMYKILGAIPRLQSIILGLDTSISSQHTEFWAQIRKPASERDPHLADPYIVDSLINSAMDEKLAMAIFRTISDAKSERSLPLERLEVCPGDDFGSDLTHFHLGWLDVIEHIERSWLVKRRYLGLGSDVLSVNQIRIDRVVRRIRLPKRLKEPPELIFRRVWPVRPPLKGNWQQDWHSFLVEPETRQDSLVQYC